ncbi:MAG: glutaredoxin family protein [Nitrospinae bacterium]|nr:glutaredoxin family protein [Nitrospinota bacterium]
MRNITFYTRNECHLCHEAKAAIMRHFPNLAIEEVDVDADPELIRLYGEEVPVGYLGETKVFKYHLDVNRLRRLLDETEPQA